MFLTVLALNTAGERLRVHFDGQDSRDDAHCVPRPRRPLRPLARWRSLLAPRGCMPCSGEDLTTFFRTRRGIVRAVDDVSLDLEAGTTLAIVGESGSGKSVFTRSMIGLHTTTNIERADGRVFFDGVDLRDVAAPRAAARLGSAHRARLAEPDGRAQPGRASRAPDHRGAPEEPSGSARRPLEPGRSSCSTPSASPIRQRRLREYPHQLVRRAPPAGHHRHRDRVRARPADRRRADHRPRRHRAGADPRPAALACSRSGAWR